MKKRCNCCDQMKNGSNAAARSSFRLGCVDVQAQALIAPRWRLHINLRVVVCGIHKPTKVCIAPASATRAAHRRCVIGPCEKFNASIAARQMLRILLAIAGITDFPRSSMEHIY